MQCWLSAVILFISHQIFFVIGFRLGFYTDPACLARNLGISMDDLTIKYYDTTEDLVEALDDRKASWSDPCRSDIFPPK